MAINKFADMSPDEINTGFVINMDEIKPFDTEKYKLQESKITSVDWSNTQYVAPVLNQLSCGACWAFAAANCLESALSIKKNISAVSHVISVQQMIDCDFLNEGCKGGMQYLAWETIQYNGYVLKDDYPYQYANA